MKVKISEISRKIITIEQIPAARKVIEVMKEDEWTVKDYAAMAARIASGCNGIRVIEADAAVVGNHRVWDAIAEGTEWFDVWVEFIAFTGDGFTTGGAYITDLWRSNADNLDDIRSHMYIRKFVEAK